MKRLIFFLLLTCALPSILAITVSSCHKEPEPTYFGDWESVSAFTPLYEYQITPEQFCRKVPEYFPISFCFEFAPQNDSIFVVNNPDAETWHWKFVCDNVADVTVTSPTADTKRMILKRK